MKGIGIILLCIGAIIAGIIAIVAIGLVVFQAIVSFIEAIPAFLIFVAVIFIVLWAYKLLTSAKGTQKTRK